MVEQVEACIKNVKGIQKGLVSYASNISNAFILLFCSPLKENDLQLGRNDMKKDQKPITDEATN